MANVLTDLQTSPATDANGSTHTESLADANKYPYIWSPLQKTAFRIAFVFFIIMCIPGSASWYKTVFNIDWTHLHYRDLYDVARFNPIRIWTVRSESGRWGLASWSNWVAILGIAIVIGLIWGWVDNKRKSYNIAYYWLQAIVRYRAGIGIIGFGFTKLFPVQMPYPSISLLNNNFGDLTGHKVFWLSIGIVPWYQVFTGVVEVAAGAFLLFRKTTAFGAALLIGALASITVVNLGYDGGVHVYASYFVLLGSFVLAYYIPRVYRLLILKQDVTPIDIVPNFSEKWQRWLRIGIKSLLVFLFLIVLFYLQWMNYLYDPYKQPSSPGVKTLRGYYHVKEFKINDRIIPEDPTDTTRWQEVIFEKWSTLAYKQNRKVPLELSNGGGGPMKDINKTFEVSGVAGGRRVFHYLADTVNQVLYLQDKNIMTAKKKIHSRGGGDDIVNPAYVVKDSSKFWIPIEALRNIGDENKTIHPRASSTRRNRVFGVGLVDEGRQKMILSYQTEDGGKRVYLRGINEDKDSIFVVLDRVDRKYAVSESTLSAGSY